MSDVLQRTESGGVVRIAFNRPDKLNAFNDEMTQALLAALDEIGSSTARVVVLTGNGRGFSAGQDLEEVIERQSGGAAFSLAEHLNGGFNKVVMRIRELGQPVIAQMNGVAAGVGFAIALSCDARIMGEDSSLTLGFSKIGLVPDGGSSYFLPLLAGFGRGLELAMTSDKIGASEALRLGLANRVVPAAELTAATDAYAAQLAGMSRSALALTKKAFNAAMMPGLAAWLEAEANLQEQAAQSADFREGVAAFIEKRKPAYAGT